MEALEGPIRLNTCLGSEDWKPSGSRQACRPSIGAGLDAIVPRSKSIGQLVTA